MTNTILWRNTATTAGSQILNMNGSNPNISYSDIQGSGGSGLSWDTTLGSDGGGNIGNNPIFVRDPDPGADSNWDGVDDDYGDLHLQAGSPAIDTGTNTGCPVTDLGGIPRPAGSICDMGAYEWFTAGVTLEPDRSGEAAPLGSATYLHTLTNTGNFSDTFTLTAASSQSWIVEVKPSEITVGMGASTTIELTITVPGNASKDDVTTVTATSNADSTVSDSVTDTTTLRFDIYLPLAFKGQ